MPSSDLRDQLNAMLNPPRKPHQHQRTLGHADSDQQLSIGWNDYYQQRYGYDAYDDPYGRDFGKKDYTKSSKPSTGSTYVSRKVYVQHKDGSLQAFSMPYDCHGWFDLATEVYPVTKEGSTDTITIPIERCEFSYGEPAFNACVYTATQDYISARWGRKLDDSDRRWLARHPLATDGGIPQESTITAIQQLVAPYGMKVSRVRIRAGALVLGDQNMQWAMALGCNPMALADRRTANADAAKLLNMDEASANQLWRLEFSDEPLPGSIVGERGWTNGTGVSVGAMGGHARYLAPRARAGDWFVSIQLAPDQEVEYLTAPPDPEYVERKGAPTLLVSRTLGPTGELIAVKDGTTWRRWTDIRDGKPATPAPSPVTPPAPTTPSAVVVGPPQLATTASTAVTPRPAASPYSPSTDTFLCTLCDSHCDDIERAYRYTTIDVCVDCALEAWRGVSCGTCDKSPRWNTLPFPVAVSADEGFEYQCDFCHDPIIVPFETDKKYLKALVNASYACFADALVAEYPDNDTPITTDVSLADLATPPTSDDPADVPYSGFADQIWD